MTDKDKSNTSHAQQESLNRFNNEFVDNLTSLKDKRKKLLKKIKREETMNKHLIVKIQALQKEQTKTLKNISLFKIFCNSLLFLMLIVNAFLRYILLPIF